MNGVRCTFISSMRIDGDFQNIRSKSVARWKCIKYVMKFKNVGYWFPC